MRRLLWAAVAVTIGVPFEGRAEAVLRALVAGPGNQTAPSLSGGRVAFLDDADGDVDVRVAGVADGAPLFEVTRQDGVAQSWPRISGDVVAYRSPGRLEVVDLGDPVRSFGLDAAGTGRIALGPTVVAWEQLDGDPRGTGSDVAWRGLADGATVVRAASGVQGSVSVAWGWVAWIDFTVAGAPGDGVTPGQAAGAIHLVDTVTGHEVTLRVPNGAAGAGVDLLAELSIGAPDALAPPTLAVTVAPYDGGLEDRRVVVLDAAGAVQARLGTPGYKINPHLVGDFVGFEDFSLLNPQVFLWNWRAPVEPLPELHAPSLSGAEQRLHDLEIYAAPAGKRIRAAWAEHPAAGDYDLWLYDAALPLSPDVDPPDEPARCDDADPVLLGALEVVRMTARPSPHGERVVFDGPLNVLVCMDGVDVTAGGVVVGTQVVAGPDDFGRGEVHREARITVPAGEGAIAAILAGKPGATLSVRVLRDGEVPPPVPPEVDTCVADGTCPRPPPGLTRGCASSGGAGGLALMLLLPALLLRRGGRRR